MIYKDALEIEFQERNISDQREAESPIDYKRIRLTRTYLADFLCFGKIIVEAKAAKLLANEFQGQVINDLKATHLRLGLLINFEETSLKVKRLIF